MLDLESYGIKRADRDYCPAHDRMAYAYPSLKKVVKRELVKTTRGIQFACVELIVRRLNELAIHFRENKPLINNLRLQLAIVRRPVPL